MSLFLFFQSPVGQQGINVKKVEDLANKLGSKFSILSRNMTQNIQTMSDKLGESGMNLADKVRTAAQRPDSRVSSNPVSNCYVLMLYVVNQLSDQGVYVIYRKMLISFYRIISDN